MLLYPRPLFNVSGIYDNNELNLTNNPFEKEASLLKKFTLGIVAPVDAGKTTLSEALLYKTNSIRHVGRVDHGDSFLDPNQVEKERGITIFAHQALMTDDNVAITLLDTPGHVDFATATERVLPVLDYAILVISAPDGVTGYSRTLWNLLAHYKVPTMIFINKVDTTSADVSQVLKEVQQEFSSNCLSFSGSLSDSTNEAIAMQNDDLLTNYLDSGYIAPQAIQKLIKQRHIFPTYSGSALKMDGIDSLLSGLKKWTLERQWPTNFNARIFKISHDAKGNQLSWTRVTGGVLHVKQELVPGQKADALRIYNGNKFQVVPQVSAGEVCAIVGPTGLSIGQGIGPSEHNVHANLMPVLSYSVNFGENDPHMVLKALEEISIENPELNVQWNSELHQIQVSVMGTVQLEIIATIIKERFNIDISFSKGAILYKETITKPIEGVGHFEPLRHYSEVHLLMEPATPGSGITYESKCPVDTLAHNWQEQIKTSLYSKIQRGVLIGAPLTDIHISLVGGKASTVHTVGGDFREATNRALRQGLMEINQQNGTQLLEPWYQFSLTLPSDQVGHALTDIQRFGGNFSSPEQINSNMTLIKGSAPVSEMHNYAEVVRSYTHGRGHLECIPDSYHSCHDAQAVIQKANYDPVADLANTPDSVFCAHGAGYPVAWDQVPKKMHCDYYTEDY